MMVSAEIGPFSHCMALRMEIIIAGSHTNMASPTITRITITSLFIVKNTTN